jgi:hypothetical protein
VVTQITASVAMGVWPSAICFFTDTATTEIYTRYPTLSLPDALPI